MKIEITYYNLKVLIQQKHLPRHNTKPRRSVWEKIKKQPELTTQMKTTKQLIYEGIKKYGICLVMAGMAIGALVARTQHVHELMNK